MVMKHGLFKKRDWVVGLDNIKIKLIVYLE